MCCEMINISAGEDYEDLVYNGGQFMVESGTSKNMLMLFHVWLSKI